MILDASRDEGMLFLPLWDKESEQSEGHWSENAEDYNNRSVDESGTEALSTISQSDMKDAFLDPY